MKLLDKVCDDILYKETHRPRWEKVAQLKMPLPPKQSMLKLAKDIREELKPVNITYEDLNSFIKDIHR